MHSQRFLQCIWYSLLKLHYSAHLLCGAVSTRAETIWSKSSGNETVRVSPHQQQLGVSGHKSHGKWQCVTLNQTICAGFLLYTGFCRAATRRLCRWGTLPSPSASPPQLYKEKFPADKTCFLQDPDAVRFPIPSLLSLLTSSHIRKAVCWIYPEEVLAQSVSS